VVTFWRGLFSGGWAASPFNCGENRIPLPLFCKLSHFLEILRVAAVLLCRFWFLKSLPRNARWNCLKPTFSAPQSPAIMTGSPPLSTICRVQIPVVVMPKATDATLSPGYAAPKAEISANSIVGFCERGSSRLTDERECSHDRQEWNVVIEDSDVPAGQQNIRVCAEVAERRDSKLSDTILLIPIQV